jgi:hypothetical protein
MQLKMTICTSPVPSYRVSPLYRDLPFLLRPSLLLAPLDCSLVRSESSPAARTPLLTAGEALHKRLALHISGPNSDKRGCAICARAVAYTAVAEVAPVARGGAGVDADGRRALPLLFVHRAGLATGWTRAGARLSGCGYRCGCGGAEVELDGREEEALGCVLRPGIPPCLSCFAFAAAGI